MRLGPPNYLRLFAASTSSNLGDGIALVALPLLAATITRDPLLVSLLAMSGQLPWLLFSLHAGAIADRVDRRLLMVYVDAGRLVIVAVIGLAAAGGWASIPLLCVLAFLLCVGETLFDNATQPFVPAVAGDLPLESANSRMFAGQIITNNFVGQPIGSLLFVAAAGLPFFVDAATFAVSIVLLLTIRGVFRAERPAQETTITRDVGEELRWLWGNRLIRSLAVLLAVMNFTFGLSAAVFVLFALDELGLSESSYGLLLTAAAAGGLAGTAIAGRMSSSLGPGRVLALMVLLSAATEVGFFVAPDPYTVGAMLFLGGLIAWVWNVITITVRQEVIPDRLLGRVTGAYRVLGVGAGPFGAVLGGVLASSFGLRAPFIAAAAINALCLPPTLKLANNRSIAAAREDASAL
jgi:MFS family permease